MVNKDGATKCLSIIQLHLSNQSIFTIYPNLSSDGSTTIDFMEKEKKNISVSDVYGKIILQKTSINEQSIHLNTEGSSGIYQVSVVNTITGER